MRIRSSSSEVNMARIPMSGSRGLVSDALFDISRASSARASSFVADICGSALQPSALRVWERGENGFGFRERFGHESCAGFGV
eukprot:3525865-Rhodomonas_salina.1